LFYVEGIKNKNKHWSCNATVIRYEIQFVLIREHQFVILILLRLWWIIFVDSSRLRENVELIILIIILLIYIYISYMWTYMNLGSWYGIVMYRVPFLFPKYIIYDIKNRINHICIIVYAHVQRSTYLGRSRAS